MVTFSLSIADATQVRLTLPTSKTDPFCKGVSILLAAQPNATTCPVTSLALLFAVDPQPPHTPLFAEIDGSPLHCTSFIQSLKTDLQSCRFNASQYSGHSFRRGAASSAAAAGYSNYELQLLGCWRSDAYCLYINVPADRLLALSAQLHWAIPVARPPKHPVPHLTSGLAPPIVMQESSGTHNRAFAPQTHP